MPVSKSFSLRALVVERHQEIDIGLRPGPAEGVCARLVMMSARARGLFRRCLRRADKIFRRLGAVLRRRGIETAPRCGSCRHAGRTCNPGRSGLHGRAHEVAVEVQQRRVVRGQVGGADQVLAGCVLKRHAWPRAHRGRPAARGTPCAAAGRSGRRVLSWPFGPAPRPRLPQFPPALRPAALPV